MRTLAAHCWPQVSNTEALTSPCASDSCYGRAEDIGVMAVVVLELGLGNVQRQILGADLVIAANDGALEQAPEALNRVRVDCPDMVISFSYWPEFWSSWTIRF